MNLSCCGRREFLSGTALAGAAGLTLTACGGDQSEDEQSQEWAVLDSSPPEVGGSSLVRHGDLEILLHREAEQVILAFSAICPHQGCTVGVEEDRFECPCHGSRFDLTGQWQSGPAEGPLTEYQAQLDDDVVQVLLPVGD